MTIYALSTGPGISGIAVIRVSGNDTANVVKKIAGTKTNAMSKKLIETIKFGFSASRCKFCDKNRPWRTNPGQVLENSICSKSRRTKNRWYSNSNKTPSSPHS